MTKAAGGRSWVGVALVLTLKALAVAVMVALPLLGVWVASSLAALRRGPVWLTLLAGLLQNPQEVFLLASYETRDDPSEPTQCHVDAGVAPRVSCKFTRPGRYDIKLFSNRERSGVYDFIGQLQANAN